MRRSRFPIPIFPKGYRGLARLACILLAGACAASWLNDSAAIYRGVRRSGPGGRPAGVWGFGVMSMGGKITIAWMRADARPMRAGDIPAFPNDTELQRALGWSLEPGWNARWHSDWFPPRRYGTPLPLVPDLQWAAYDENWIRHAYGGLDIPYAFLVLLLAVPPLISRVRRRIAAVAAGRRTTSGKCPDCGYDCRATPARCPECGRPLPLN